MQYDRFDGNPVGLFFYDDEGDWFAYFVEQPSISVFGDTPSRALDELASAWEEAKAADRGRQDEPESRGGRPHGAMRSDGKT